LPGVFLDNPRAGIVNQNLWTLHAELFSYAIMAVLMVTKVVYNQRYMLSIFIGLSVLLVISKLNGAVLLNGTFNSKVLVYSFVAGIVFYHYRYSVKIRASYFIASAIFSYILLKTDLYIISLPFIYYIMVFIGMTEFPRIGWLQNGDYSYGLYLYGYPVQQLIVMMLPDNLREWWIVFILATPCAFFIAYFSWTYVEKPTLRLKNYLKKPKVDVNSVTHPPTSGGA